MGDPDSQSSQPLPLGTTILSGRSDIEDIMTSDAVLVVDGTCSLTLQQGSSPPGECDSPQAPVFPPCSGLSITNSGSCGADLGPGPHHPRNSIVCWSCSIGGLNPRTVLSPLRSNVLLPSQPCLKGWLLPRSPSPTTAMLLPGLAS